MKRKRTRVLEGLLNLLPPPEEFKMRYDLDYVPPPPRPEPMRSPLPGEPDYRLAVPLVLKDVDERVRKTKSEDSVLRKILRLEFATDDGMELVWMPLFDTCYLEMANTVVEAFVSEDSAFKLMRHGSIGVEQVKKWIGRWVLADLEFKRWPAGSGWQVKRLHPPVVGL